MNNLYFNHQFLLSIFPLVPEIKFVNEIIMYIYSKRRITLQHINYKIKLLAVVQSLHIDIILHLTALRYIYILFKMQKAN